MRYLTRPRTRAGVALAMLLLTLATVGPASAATSGTLTVTGESVATLEITIADTTGAFGTTLTPQGTTSTGADTLVANVDGGSPSTGACYEWTSSVTVSSNIVYDVNVTPAAANANLDFVATDPATYAACTGGTAIGTTAFNFVNAGTAVAGRTHNLWLGLDVTWTTAPSTTLGAASLTIAVVQDAA